ncbi:MAG TPA: sensor domain-containing diguanylate cyclase [Solirubrobacteraceae bacterium]|nr:sensor domain-containing diguanylate cyclase [Solirubrobacteraceae bacterium]
MATRATGVGLVAGAAFVVLSLALPHPAGANIEALIAIATAMLLVGLFCWALFDRLPPLATHLALAAGAVGVAATILESSLAVGQYSQIFIWLILVSAYYFPRKIAAAHLAWALAAYAIALFSVQSTGGYSPLTRWLFTAVSLTGLMLLTNAIVARRSRADKRARRFFELSHDMLCTTDIGGRYVELNNAWQQSLGYGLDELRAIAFIELVHPEDRERVGALAAAAFGGAEHGVLEYRVLAKDGSWHWLRSSSTLAEDEGLLYSRATDVTELKRIEAEREQLLREVQSLARSDALTGLPNRRALDEALPREFARASRAESPLCVALLDLDHFKAYNDTHGHLAGDEVLRESAIAWESSLRGEDLIVRFGGEEFLVLLPGCSLEQAAETIERLRSAMPRRQTCSAGIACWDFCESPDELVRRADDALYGAKSAGRDRLLASV